MSKQIYFIAATLLLSGCQTLPYEGQARDVKRKPGVEGIVSLPMNPRPEDRLKADERMNSNCNPLPPKILEEGEVVVGQETQTSGSETQHDGNQHKVGSLFGVPVMSGDPAGKNTNSSSVTKAVKEWQISYRCETKPSVKR